MGCAHSTEVDYATAAQAKQTRRRSQMSPIDEIQGRAYGSPTAGGGGARSSSQFMEPATGFGSVGNGNVNGKWKADEEELPESAAGKYHNDINFRPPEIGVAASMIASAPKKYESLASKTSTVSGKSKKSSRAHHLKNVYAAPLDQADVTSFRPPVFVKSDGDRALIMQALEGNFVFSALTDREMSTIIDAFEQVDVPADATIITQGDDGDFFYVIIDGRVKFQVNGSEVGQAKRGKSFGELALLYTCPRAASAIAMTDCALYRVDQKTFRYIMQSQTLQAQNDKKELLQGVSFFKDLDSSDIEKLISVLTPRHFEVGECIVRKGDMGDSFYVIQEGKIKVKDISIGQVTYEDAVLGPGEYFGERAIITNEPRTANCVGKTKGTLLTIDRETFETVVGRLSNLILKSQDKRKLAAIKVFQQTHLSGGTLATLASEIVDVSYPKGSVIVKENELTSAALYFVREGRIEIKNEAGTCYNVVEEDGYFGEDMLMHDVATGGTGGTDTLGPFTATAKSVNAVLGVLTLEQCRKAIDTTTFGKQKKTDYTSIVETEIPLNSLTKHRILGAGTFGQVWLVSKVTKTGEPRPYALKVQSKYELIQSSQVKGVIQERNIMAQLNHPFIINLVKTYQDKSHIYMLLQLVQGGELYSLLHQDEYDGINEKDARFYSACILEGLSYMHRRNILYRDLKPENILIDHGGYPVIVDLGFAKIVTNKTYTLCGTPLYIAPEVILNRGHDKGADHWSWAILIYEMISGYTPFYEDGMDQITLFKQVVSGEYKLPAAGVMSTTVEDLIQRVLRVDPAKRLGSLARGIDEIYNHTWFIDYDFNKLRRKEYESPWKPNIEDPLDGRHFDNWDHLEDKLQLDQPKLSSSQQQLFAKF